MHRSITTLALLALLTSSAWGQTLNSVQTLTQSEFRQLSEDLGGALSYRPQIPTTPLGTTGFDIGVADSAVKLAHPAIMQKAASGTVRSTMHVPTLRAHKGLPFGIDFGLAQASVPGSNIKYTGGELRYALVSGGVTTPAVGLRGSFSRLSGVSQIDLSTRGADLSISKGFALVTPYAGVGRVWVTSDPKAGIPVLARESFALNKSFVGLCLKLGLFALNVEADRTGAVSATSVKIGLQF